MPVTQRRTRPSLIPHRGSSMNTKKTRVGPLFSGIAAGVLLVLGAASGIGDALTLSPTSVSPTLPAPHEARAMRTGDSRGLFRSMQHAHREAVERAWIGVPVVER